MLSALSIGPFEVTRLRLAGDAASYRYGFSKLRGCHGEGFRWLILLFVECREH